MIKYRARGLNSKIEKIEIVGETDHFVKLANGRRDAKKSDWQRYFDTFDEAKTFLVEKAQSRVDSLRRGLESANGDLGRIKGIKES